MNKSLENSFEKYKVQYGNKNEKIQGGGYKSSEELKAIYAKNNDDVNGVGKSIKFFRQSTEY
jgi:hypothetical protein